MGVYLDYNATTPVDERVLDYMIDIYRNHYGNADSRTHQFGSDARKIVEKARASAAELLGVPRTALFFTSGSTESSNMAIFGLEQYGRKTGRMHIITTSMEHKSVLEPCRILAERGFEVEYVDPGESGRVSAEDVLGRVRKDTLLVSVMHVNNETGTVQPVQEIGEALEQTGVLFHLDAAQSFGKLTEEIRRIPFDLLSASAHKMYGPQGVGVLVAQSRKAERSGLQPILYGGGQEQGLRPGTLPVALIGGLGRAAEIAMEESAKNHQGCLENQNTFLRILKESGVSYQINGDLACNSGNTLNVSFTGYDSEALMVMMQMGMGAGFSNGSACLNTGSYHSSYVLQAMGLSKERIESAVRISWGREKVEEAVFQEIVQAVKDWQQY